MHRGRGESQCTEGSVGGREESQCTEGSVGGGGGANVPGEV